MLSAISRQVTNRYIQFSQTGGCDVLELKKEDIPAPKENQLVVKNEAIGFNLADTYFRKGLYETKLPQRAGCEAAGLVYAVGPGVDEFEVGDRVAYIGEEGAYADYTIVSTRSVAKIPDSISFDVAAATTLKGLTAQYLLGKVYTPQRDEIVVFHAGAGGLGLIFLQWARNLGVKVIATVSSDEKATVAKSYGAWQVLKYTDDIPQRVKELTDGEKVKVVYDGVGKDTFAASLDCLAPRGLYVLFGNSSGLVPDFNPLLLGSKGSLYMTFPFLDHYVENLQQQLDAFFELITEGVIDVVIDSRYSLNDISCAHTDAESRKNVGSIVISP